MKPKLLIVDDDENIRTQMKWALADDYDVVLAEERGAAMQSFHEGGPDVVLLDLGLPPKPNDLEEGFLALDDILSADPLAKVIVITGQGEKENAMRAITEGAYDFLAKPIETEELKVILKRAFYVSRLEREHRDMEQRLGGKEGFEQMLGASPQMMDLFASIRKVAATDAPVLVLGESGTGKEMAALAVHHRSARKDGPFVTINCSAIPEPLLESELFGHEKGAFTGAHIQRKGRIEKAAEGTLFLDEIGELPPSLQVKLLRFLQEQVIERVGGRQEIPIDTRVVAATNSNLKTAMQDASFREDLYYRLAVVVLRLPPLREREGDIPLLAKAFLKRFAADNNSAVTGFSQKAMQGLQAYEWPGNVREMENRIKRAVIMAEGRLLKESDLDLGPLSSGRAVTLKEARESLEKDLIQKALNRNRGRISRAATELEISRPTLYDMMEKYGISRERKG